VLWVGGGCVAYEIMQQSTSTSSMERTISTREFSLCAVGCGRSYSGLVVGWWYIYFGGDVIQQSTLNTITEREIPLYVFTSGISSVWCGVRTCWLIAAVACVLAIYS
jgi:hypothetical protein